MMANYNISQSLNDILISIKRRVGRKSNADALTTSIVLSETVLKYMDSNGCIYMYDPYTKQVTPIRIKD